MGMDRGRCAAGARAARDEQNPQRADDLGRDLDARLSRRGAAEHRVCVAFRAADPCARRATGTEIRVNAGVIASVVEAGAPEGTRDRRRDLFYNLPARRKFLKSDRGGGRARLAHVTQLALALPEVGFTLTSAGRTLLDVPPARDAAERLYQLYGDRHDLVQVSRGCGRASLTGFVAALAEQGPAVARRTCSSTGRIVRDSTIAHAIVDAYSVASIKERSPEVHLFIEMPLDARRRQRASHEGGGSVPRAVAGARSRPPRARRRARPGPGAAAHLAAPAVVAGPARCSPPIPGCASAAVSEPVGADGARLGRPQVSAADSRRPERLAASGPGHRQRSSASSVRCAR